MKTFAEYIQKRKSQQPFLNSPALGQQIKRDYQLLPCILQVNQ